MEQHYTNPAAPGVYAKNPFEVDGNVVQLQLTQGQVALIDLADLALVAGHKWCAFNTGKRFYAVTKIYVDGEQRNLHLHRLLCETTSGFPLVDHSSRDSLDNRRANLRACTRQQNVRNQGLSTRNKSGYKGVSFVSQRGKYKVQIKYLSQNKFLGSFDDPLEAAQVYDEAAKLYFGDFAVLNFPN